MLNYLIYAQINEMRRLVSDAQDGDRFVFFFSGHGDQIEAKNDPNETDNKDECGFLRVRLLG